jgi:hypothetical protein
MKTPVRHHAPHSAREALPDMLSITLAAHLSRSEHRVLTPALHAQALPPHGDTSPR